MEQGRPRRFERPGSPRLSGGSADPNLAEVSPGTPGNRERLVEWGRVHVLLDDGPAIVVDLFQNVPERAEVDGAFGWLAEDVHPDSPGEDYALGLDPPPDVGIDAL